MIGCPVLYRIELYLYHIVIVNDYSQLMSSSCIHMQWFLFCMQYPQSAQPVSSTKIQISLYKLKKFKIFSRTENFPSRRQAFFRSQYGFLRSEEMLTLTIFNTVDVLVLVYPATFYGHCGKWQPHCNGRCCSHCVMMVDVVAMHYVSRCYANRFITNLWQNFEPHNIVVLCGRCYGPVCLASGRWYCHRWQIE